MFIKIYDTDDKAHIVNVDHIVAIAETKRKGEYLLILTDNFAAKIDVCEKQRVSNMVGYV